MTGYTVAELAELLREYSHMGISPDQSLALAEHLDELAQVGAAPALSPSQVAEWRVYQTLVDAAEAAGLEFAEGLTEGQREDAARDYFVAAYGRWDVVEVGGGSSYLMRERGSR